MAHEAIVERLDVPLVGMLVLGREFIERRPDGKRLHTVAEIAQAVGVHRTTVYDYLKKED